jgi:predicted enzyme related to lactoylglutathione lyase
MEKVLGIGGVFFKARDPEGLLAWYREHLGVPVDAPGYATFKTADDPGPLTVFAAFKSDTTYFEPSKSPFMINFKVKSLDAMLAQLRAAGATVDDKVQDEPYGRFGWAMDPEGNRFELWEPK